MRATVAVLLTAVFLGGCGERRAWVRREHIPYGDVTANPGATYDAYVPRRASPGALALIYIHGGAWRGGDKLMVGVEDLADEVCGRGGVMFSVNYRLAPAYRWPAQLEDVTAAWRHLRATAPLAFGVRADAMTVMGTSAGAHLAANLYLRAERGSRPAGCVAEAGEHDLDRAPGEVMHDYASIVADVLGHSPPFAREELDRLSSVPFARQDARVLLIHAVGDTNVYVQQSRALALALEQKRADVRYLEVPGAQHGGAWEGVRGDFRAFLTPR